MKYLINKSVYAIICFLTLFNSINAADETDANWMKYLPDSKYLNEINIPGTHDSGTYDIGQLSNSKIWNKVMSRSGLNAVFSAKSEFGRTQDLDIKEQLEHGIRYLDIRLSTTDEKKSTLYLSHGNNLPAIDTVPCVDINSKNDVLYFSQVIKECIDFLKKHTKETIIMHLKEESISEKTNDVAKLIGTEIKDLSEYFYDGTTVPQLGKVRGKIVLFTRNGYKYNNKALGIRVNVKDMGGCRDYPDDGKKCYPVLYNNSDINFKYLIQDAYNLDGPDKWDLVQNTITKFVSFKDNEDKIITGSKNTDLTINFMNMGRMEFSFDNAEKIRDTAGDFLFDSGIEESANYVNNELTKYVLDTKYSGNLDSESKPIYNNWFILDFPTEDVIRSIYQSNNFKDTNLNKNKVEVSGWEEFYADSKYYVSQIPVVGGAAETVIDIADTVIGWFSKKDGQSSNKRTCLQRHSNTDKVSVLSKCVKNSKNQWYINSNGKYYNIISAYDNKCLSYNKNQNTLEISKCDKSNHNIDFTVKDRIICSRVDENKCLNGKFDLLYVTLQSNKYNNLLCSSRFAKHGYPCCSDQTIKTQYVDNIGNWGVENGKLCGLGYERCSFEALGYRCCSNANPKVAYTDKNGLWGFENGEWCGIGEATIDPRIRIKNRKTQECLITNLHSDTNILLMGDCNHSAWTYKNNQLVLDATGKCLYAMNSHDPRMMDCNKPDEQINHHIHFKIVDDKYICIKNNVDPEDRCLNGNTKNGDSLRFETLKDEYSEWYIESLNGKVVSSINEVIRNNSDLDYEEFKPSIPKATTVPTTTITKTTTTTTTRTKPNATPKPGYSVYWFYHAFTDNCLHAPQNINGKITVKACDNSNYSKWMSLPSRKGYFYSMAYPDYCLHVDNISTGSISLGKCDEQANFEHNNKGFFVSHLSDDKCIGLLNSKDKHNDEIKLNLNKCTQNNEEKFYVWDHNPSASSTSTSECFSEALGFPCCSPGNTKVIYVDESGLWGVENNDWCGIITSSTPNTETYYLYNANLNKCIYTSGKLHTQIILSDCDYSKNTLWEIPYTHNGKIRSKINPNYCIMLSDVNKGTLTLGKCEKDGTTFYRENNFILSSSSKDTCIGTSEANTSALIMKTCSKSNIDQIFYFNLWLEKPLE